MKERAMTMFGNLKTFDQATGVGSIIPEKGGDPITFEKSAFSWKPADAPKVDTRLSYELGKNQAGSPVAINLHTV
jgi:CspA family cold shock protein